MLTNQKDGDALKHQTASRTALISQSLWQASEVSPLCSSLRLHLALLHPFKDLILLLLCTLHTSQHPLLCSYQHSWPVWLTGVGLRVRVPPSWQEYTCEQIWTHAWLHFQNRNSWDMVTDPVWEILGDGLTSSRKKTSNNLECFLPTFHV